MSSIDMQNPKVLKNFLTNQAKEGKGTFFVKEKVICFRNKEGLEFIVPDEVPQEIVDKYLGKKEEVKEETEEKSEKEKEFESLSDEQIKELAKEAGIKGYALSKRETLIKKLL